MGCVHTLRRDALFVGPVLIALFSGWSAPPLQAATAFNFPPIPPGTTLSATLSVDFAEFTGDRTIGGHTVNMLQLVDVNTGLGSLDLSDAFFGTATPPAPPRIDQMPMETGLFSVAIDSGFFPALESGSVGLWALFTDTSDALFAIDTILLTIDTESVGTIEAFHGSPNDGFRLGIADNADLPGPLPDSLPPTGTGFDEPISSKSIHAVPEPTSAALLLVGLFCGLAHRRHRRRACAAAALRPVTAGVFVAALLSFWLAPHAGAQVEYATDDANFLETTPAIPADELDDAVDAALAGLPHVPGEVLVIFDPVEESSGRDLLNVIGAAEIAYYDQVRVHQVRAPFGWTVTETVVYLSAQPGVVAVSPNYIRIAAGDHLTRPNDPKFPSQWHLDNRGINLVGVGGATGPVPGIIDADIDAPQAWEHGTDCSDIIIAVFDSGVDVSHPDIADNIWVNPGETDGNNMDDDGNGVVDDTNGASFIERERHAERRESLTDNNGNNRLDNADTIYWDADFDNQVSAADVALAGPAQPNGTAMARFRNNWRHTDNVRGNRVFDNGESIYADVDNNNQVSMGDVRLFGPAAANGTRLVPMLSGGDGFQPGEPIYLDADGTLTVTGADGALSPGAVTTPNNDARLIDFAASERFVDSNNNGRYDTNEPVYRDNNGDGRVDAGDTAIVGNAANGAALAAFGIRPTGNVSDLFGHGTNVSGVIAARGNNNIGIAGVCWQAQVMVLRVAGATNRAPDGAVIAAVNYVLARRAAGRDVRLVNYSFAGAGFSRVVRNAFSNAPGLLFVVPAGNDATDNDPGGQYSEPLYIDADNSGSVTVGDTRLTPFGQPGSVLPAGAVQAADADVTMPLSNIFVPGRGGRPPPAQFRHDDLNGNRRFDAGEMIYFDADNDSTVSAGDQRRGLIQFGANQWGFGIVGARDPDVGNGLANFQANERFWDRPMELFGGQDRRRPAGQAASYPCAYSVAPIICVAASNSLDHLASFSGWGMGSVEVVAPGRDILTLRRAADGAGTRLVSGTSFAAPIVTGIFAHAWTRPAYQNLTAAQIRQLVLNGDSPLGERFAHGVDPRFGLQGSVIFGINNDGRARMVSGADFGDAPPPYPTQGGGLRPNPPIHGARHEDIGEEWLGRDPDLAESLDLPQPQPPTDIGQDAGPEFEAFDSKFWPFDPDGRDNESIDGDAHDDGVELLGPFTFSPAAGPPNRAKVRVWIRTANAGVNDADTDGRYASSPDHGRNNHSNDDGVHGSRDDKHVWVNGWFDWNRDGDWEDPAEHAFMLCANPNAWTAPHPNAGVYDLEFDMPTAPIHPGDGELWTRFRLDYGENSGQTTGLAVLSHAVAPSQGGAARFWNDLGGLPLRRPLFERPRYESIETEPPRVRLMRGVAEFGECEDYLLSGTEPDQLHLTGPTPNTIRVGTTANVIAAVENNFVGLPDQTVRFEKVLGSFSFLNGSNPGGTSTELLTGPDGTTRLEFRADAAGIALIRATVVGTSLETFAFFQIVPGRGDGRSPGGLGRVGHGP